MCSPVHVTHLDVGAEIGLQTVGQVARVEAIRTVVGDKNCKVVLRAKEKDINIRKPVLCVQYDCNSPDHDHVINRQIACGFGLADGHHRQKESNPDISRE
jgi:hypothetical protein